MEYVIFDSEQAGAPADLPAGAGGGHRVPEPDAVEAEFAGADGALVQCRWTQAAVAVKFEQLAPVAAFPAGAGAQVGAGPVVVGHERPARDARVPGDMHANDAATAASPGGRASRRGCVLQSGERAARAEQARVREHRAVHGSD
ncbi:hypothetical protein GCM10017687_10340 [Streptomyces echinatus]